MDRIMHCSIHKVAEDKSRKKHERIGPHDQIHQGEYDRSNMMLGTGGMNNRCLSRGIVMVIPM